MLGVILLVVLFSLKERWRLPDLRNNRLLVFGLLLSKKFLDRLLLLGRREIDKRPVLPAPVVPAVHGWIVHG